MKGHIRAANILRRLIFYTYLCVYSRWYVFTLFIIHSADPRATLPPFSFAATNPVCLEWLVNTLTISLA